MYQTKCTYTEQNGLIENKMNLNHEASIKDQERKVKIIAWLLPRFDKGLSDPKNYTALIGKVEP